MLETFIHWALPFVMGGVVTAITKNYKENKTIKSALLSLVRFEIVELCERAQKDKYLSEYSRISLESLRTQYKVLGGNHGIEVLIDKTFNLPIK